MAKIMARLQNGVVVNVERHSDNTIATDTLVPTDKAQVRIGDTYLDGKFYRDGVLVLTTIEALHKEISEYDSALSEIEAAIGITNTIHAPISAVIDKRKQDIISRISEML